MAVLFLLAGIGLTTLGIAFLLNSDCFDELKKGMITLAVGIVFLLIPAMVPSNEEIIDCQAITASIDIGGEKVVTDVPVKWTWKERSVNHFSYASLKGSFFDYKVEVAE